MARNFDKNNEKIDLGDVTNARFSAGAAWTSMAFFRVETLTAAASVFSKHPSGASARQFFARILTSGIWRIGYNNGGTTISTASSVVSTNTWYLGVATNSSGDTTNVYIYDMAGVQQGSGSGSHPGDVADLTGSYTLGTQDDNGSDYDGDIAFSAYFSKEFSTNEILAYLHNPVMVAAQHGNDTIFFLPLLGNASPEPDWSGNGNSGTVSAGTWLDGDNPPVSAFLPMDFSLTKTSLDLVEVIGETANISTASLAFRDLVRLLSETVQIAETKLTTMGLRKLLDETIEVSEGAALSVRGLTRLSNEVVDLVEALGDIKSLIRLLAETVNINSETLRVLGLTQIINEVVNIYLIGEANIIIDHEPGDFSQYTVAPGDGATITSPGLNSTNYTLQVEATGLQPGSVSFSAPTKSRFEVSFWLDMSNFTVSTSNVRVMLPKPR